jgi:hypothetical protein
VPPRFTTFDTAGDGDRDPIDRRIAENVRRFLRFIRQADPDTYPVLLGLLSQRREMVWRELQVARMLSPDPMPPLLANFFTLDFLGQEDSPISTYVNLLNEIDETADFIRSQFVELKIDPPPSDL